MSARSYSNVDLSENNPTIKQLITSAEAEASAKTIKLTDQVGAIPANMTPAMTTWYQQIVSERSAALDEVAVGYQVTDPETGAEGVFIKRESDKIKEQLLIKKREVERDFRHGNQNLFDSLEDAKKQRALSNRRYAEMVARYNREAKRVPKWYWLAMFVIGLAECMINYESFSSVRNFTPAIALGTTILVAVALAVSSHMHGSFMAQFRSRFGPHADDGDRGAAIRMLSLGTLSLSVVLGLVWYARSSYFADILIENATIGGLAPSALTTIGGSMAANVLVWVVGVIIAFLCHDEDHRFPVALKEKDSAQANLQSLQVRVSKPLQRDFEKASAEAEIAKRHADARQQSFAHTNAHKAAQQLEASVVSQDARVLGILMNYRTRVISIAQNTGTNFQKQTDLVSEEPVLLTPSEYASETINLKYL